MKRIGIIVVIMGLTGLLRAEPPATQPAPYVIEPLAQEDPTIHGQIVRVDLTNPNLQIEIGSGGPDPDGDGPWETVLQPTSVIAKANQFDIAINTVFFLHLPSVKESKVYRIGEPSRSTALLMSQGKVLCGQRGGASIVFDKKNNAYIGKVGVMPAEAWTIATGDQQIVFRGRNTANNDPQLAPRTGIGLANGGKTLVLLVVDGRRTGWSEGMSMTQLADEMLALGCDSAINLDGGGSTTLVERQADKYKVVNIPSDGSALPIPLSIERPVPYVLGLRFKPAAATQPGK